jgi:ATP-dependent DNA helicase RecG
MKLGNNYTSLIIGDVGSGKTYVALVSALAYIKESKASKVCLVAPTEVLAYQHYQQLVKLLKQLGIEDINTIYLSGKNKLLNGDKITKFKNDELLDKKIFCIGTHAVFNIFETNFDLVIVDEQHRFGVNQRGIFANSPHHFLSFTATPIPRTLALSLFSTLNTQFLERLEGRATITTKIITFDKVLNDDFCDMLNTKYISKGVKVYIVCPKIEVKESEDKIYSVDEIYEFFDNRYKGKILRLTGKDKNKKETIAEFKTSLDYNILVSTSVIEVGIDIAQARVMIIMNSERFGLAALHQLRGRIGRNNEHDNICYLAIDKKYLRSSRLQVLVNSQDGFQIAQEDLKIRGSGDIAGSIQSGFAEEIEFITNIDDNDLIKLQQEVTSLDLKTLPRLHSYIINKLKNYHGE